ncbi:pimeloyl-ACP methyl ester carboxylesterase [Methanobacterium oryzae]
MESLTPEMLIGSGLPEAYADVAPNPDNWAKLVEKFKKLDVEYNGRTPEEFQSIKAPTLIMIGDSDAVPPKKAVEMFKLLGGGVFGDIVGLPRSQLAVIPGTTHAGIMERADWWSPMIKEFLDKPMKAAGTPK